MHGIFVGPQPGAVRAALASSNSEDQAIRQFQHVVREAGDSLRAVHDPAGTIPRIGAAREGVLALGGRPATAGSAGAEQARTGGRRDIAVVFGSLDDAHAYPYLLHELEALGARPRMIPAQTAGWASDGTFLVEGRHSPLPEAVIARSMSEEPNLRLLQQLEDRGVHVVNRAGMIRQAAGKVAQAQLAERVNIPRPHTVVVTDAASARAAAEQTGFPAIFKFDLGSGGSGVRKADDPAELEAVLEDAFGGPRPERAALVQEFVPGGDVDLRVHVVRDAETGAARAVSAMRRFAAEGDFVANGAGSTTERVALDTIPDEARLAERMADAVGADNMGVDVLPGARFGETNPTPGTTELDTPLPWDEHALPRVAAYAVFGQR